MNVRLKNSLRGFALVAAFASANVQAGMHNPKYGELDDDEKMLKATTLQESFYRHLISLKGKAQIIILENTDPPEAEGTNMNRIVFTGEEGRGRFGFFPMQSNHSN